jgi:hypothetical protein
MYKHLVLWKLKSEAHGTSKAKNAQLVKVKVESLKYSIPEIEFVDVGINICNYEAVNLIRSVMEAEEIVDFI